VFPDGELSPVTEIMTALQDSGLEVRDAESLREHYTLTLRAWLANLAARREEAEADVGVGRERVWRLYMLGSALGFADADVTVYQVLSTRPDAPHDLPLQRSLPVEGARCEGGRNHSRRGGLPHGALTG
jgi:cyclopropane-fatty-acyl-phospholipid synthase